MSRSNKEDKVLAKNKRRGVIDASISSTRSIKHKDKLKTFVLEYQPRYRNWNMGWAKWKAYATKEEAQRVLNKQLRVLPTWGWRIVER